MTDMPPDSSFFPLGGLPDELLMKVLEILNSKDRFTMCQVSSRFKTLVHSCKGWSLNPERESSSTLARFSNTINIIKNLNISHGFADFGDDSLPSQLSSEDFYKLFKKHPEIKYLDLSKIDTETLNYLGYFCNGLTHLRTEIFSESRAAFRIGFGSLEVLDLTVDTETGRNYKWFLVKEISALAKLRVLRLKNFGLWMKEDTEEIETLPKMELLESLEMVHVNKQFAKELVKLCSSNLVNVLVEYIGDDEFYYLIENCPKLKSVGLGYDCGVSDAAVAVMFKKLGKQLEYIHINEGQESGMRRTDLDLSDLLKSKPTKLRAITLDLGPNNIDDDKMESLLKLIMYYGGQLEWLILWGYGLDDEVLESAVRNCPLLKHQARLFKVFLYSLPKKIYKRILF